MKSHFNRYTLSGLALAALLLVFATSCDEQSGPLEDFSTRAYDVSEVSNAFESWVASGSLPTYSIVGAPSEGVSAQNIYGDSYRTLSNGDRVMPMANLSDSGLSYVAIVNDADSETPYSLGLISTDYIGVIGRR